MKTKVFSVIMTIMSLALHAQTPVAEGDSTIRTTASSIYKVGDELVVSISIHITRNLSSSESLVLVPTVADSLGHLLELPSIYINSRKQQIIFDREISRKEKDAQSLQRRNGTTQSLHYLRAIPFKKWMNHASLSLTEKSCGCGIPTKEIFTCIASLSTQPKFVPHLAFITPNMEESKIRYESGSAFIDFPINDTIIHKTFSNNTTELNKIIRTIDIIKNDTNTAITHINIHGYASPDGPFKLNEQLSRDRTEALKKYVCQLYAFDLSLIHTSYTPEDWEGFEALLSDTVFKQKGEVMRWIESDIHPDQKEAKLKKQLPEFYDFVLKNWFPILRHSDYTVEYHVRPFTVKESKKVFETNPKNLSLDEMFRLALTYTPGSKPYNEIFMTAVSLHPDNPVANLNAACIALAQRELQTAALYLEKAPEMPEKLLANGVLFVLQNKYPEAIRMFEQAQKAGLAQAEDNLKQLQELK